MHCGERHKKLKDGKGKCSVPMWCNGIPAGFCNMDAFGHRPEPEYYWTNSSGERSRSDLKYDGHVPGLACPAHGGPSCPGMEIEPGVYSGCDQSGGDCPTCGK